MAADGGLSPAGQRGLIETAGGHVEWLDVPAARIRAAHWPEGSRGAVLLLNGRSEFIEKHLETIAELQARRFAVWTLDWRGQGASSRHTPDPLAQHIQAFDDYLDDLSLLIDRHIQPTLAGRPLVMLGYSMGGHIGARALAQRPGLFARAILCNPMIDVLRRGRAPGRAVRLLVRLACLVPAQRTRYAPGPARTPDPDRPFSANPLTACPERFAQGLALVRDHPDLAVGGVTWGWLHAAFTSIAFLRRPATLACIDAPVLVALSAADTVVDNRATRRFAAALPHATLLEVSGARHELLRELDHHRASLWAAVDEFLAPIV